MRDRILCYIWFLMPFSLSHYVTSSSCIFFRDTVHTVTFFHISEFKSIKMYNYYEFCQGLCHQTEEEEVVEKNRVNNNVKWFVNRNVSSMLKVALWQTKKNT